MRIKRFIQRVFQLLTRNFKMYQFQRHYTQLTRFVARGPRASQCPLYQKTTNQVNWVLYQNIIEESSKISRSVQFSFFGIVLYPDLDRQ